MKEDLHDKLASRQLAKQTALMQIIQKTVNTDKF